MLINEKITITEYLTNLSLLEMLKMLFFSSASHEKGEIIKELIFLKLLKEYIKKHFINKHIKYIDITALQNIINMEYQQFMNEYNNSYYYTQNRSDYSQKYFHNLQYYNIPTAWKIHEKFVFIKKQDMIIKSLKLKVNTINNRQTYSFTKSLYTILNFDKIMEGIIKNGKNIQIDNI